MVARVSRRSVGVPRQHQCVRLVGSDAGENPWISEAGRSFLSTQLERLTPDHVRAIFETARVDRLGEVTQWQDGLKKTYTGVDAWVAVFMDKVCQIEQRHCGA